MEPETSQSPESQSTTLIPDSPFVTRFKGVIHELVDVAQGSDRVGKMAIILHAIADELAEELNDVDETNLQTYWEWMSHIIAWIGHGRTEDLPIELQPFANNINAKFQLTQPMPAIESGEPEIVDAEIVQ